jgi:folate-binding protein YgfZ
MATLNLQSCFKVLHIMGEKAFSFVQNQFTNDVRQASTHRLQWQAYCDRQGLVQSIFGLWGKEDHFYLLMSVDLLENTQKLLEKYGVFSKIHFQVLSPAIHLTLENQAEKNLQWEIKEFNQTKLHLCWKSWFDPQTSSSEDLIILRQAFIQHGFPWLSEKTVQLFRPHDLNLPTLGIVNFKKGCYPGQEIIARMQYRGKPKYGLHCLNIEGAQDFQPAQAIMEGERQIGTVVDSVKMANRIYLSAVLLAGMTIAI